MPRKAVKKNKHKITSDLILDLYKHTNSMPEPEKKDVVDKIKKLVKYIGKEMVVDI